MLMVLSVIVLVVNIGLSAWQERAMAEARDAAAQLPGLAAQVMEDTKNASRGENALPDALRQSRSTTATAVGVISSLRDKGQGNLEGHVKRVEESWNNLSSQAAAVEQSAEQVASWSTQINSMNQGIVRLQGLANELANAVAGGTSTPTQTAIAMQQAILVANLGRDLAQLQAGGQAAHVAGDTFKRDLELFEQRMDRLHAMVTLRPELGTAYKALSDFWNTLKPTSEALLAATPSALTVQDQAEKAQASGQALMESGQALNRAMGSLGTLRDFRVFPNFWWNVVLGVTAMLGLGLFLVATQRAREREQQARMDEQLAQSGRTQQAIMQLMSELDALGDGDLTVKAPVTEDVTGAIADAINYAVDELRNLVTTINTSAVAMGEATDESQATSQALALAAEEQFEQIDLAAKRVDDMDNSVKQVHNSATSSAEVAQRAVLIATEGAHVVRETIKGMDQIRDQIQETSKRIKRLGESTQEIGSIIELIKDISEQTNVLSLNAAMRAASAGEEGRGFAVVADEVQRLADRTSLATRRVETLVMAIQADTNDAVSSMEQTTSEVVSGARLAEDAGMALEEIVKVSQALDGNIKHIAVAAKEQQETAGVIRKTMDIIRQISGQTRQDAGHTAQSIGRMSEVSISLRESVAGFKLPAPPAPGETAPAPMRAKPRTTTAEPAGNGKDRPLA
jgi:twitching motility protein PilJ